MLLFRRTTPTRRWKPPVAPPRSRGRPRAHTVAYPCDMTRRSVAGLPVTTLVDLLGHRAAEQRDERAYVFLSDKGEEEAVLTFGELHRRAAVVATRLRQTSSADDRAL